MDDARKERLLAEINARVPPGIDWKKGAQEYLSLLIREQGAHNEFYHLIKPFIGGDDFSSFLDEMYRFLNIMAIARLDGRSRVLDVGCGPGWISHYLGKLGITVVGIDISQELLDIAARRLAGDPFPAMGAFRVKFLLHDIETAPVAGEDPFDLAIFESVLHHFLDPVSVLENVARGMKDDGLLVIAEGVAPEPGSPGDQGYQYLMQKYHALERPFTREQLVEMLEIAGFAHYQFFEPVNGWLPRTNEAAAEISRRLRAPSDCNFLVASRSANRIQATRGIMGLPAPQPAESGRSLPAAMRLEEILGLAQEAFLEAAYLQILGRAPDPEGAAHYRLALERGALTRVEVLGRLAYSREGLRHGRRPAGLARAFARATAAHVARRLVPGGKA